MERVMSDVAPHSQSASFKTMFGPTRQFGDLRSLWCGAGDRSTACEPGGACGAAAWAADLCTMGGVKECRNDIANAQSRAIEMAGWRHEMSSALSRFHSSASRLPFGMNSSTRQTKGSQQQPRNCTMFTGGESGVRAL